jgi:hypothetical protein
LSPDAWHQQVQQDAVDGLHREKVEGFLSGPRSEA